MPSPLFTDRYCLSMAQSFYLSERNDRVSFEMFVRRLPEHRDYLVVAGLGTALWWLKNLTFTGEDYEYLHDEGFDEEFCRWLFVKTAGKSNFFTGDIWAVPEGTVVGAQTPILRVTAPRIEATLLESMLLSIINHQTMIASKASRIVQAANNKPVWDFSLRRLHGPEAAIGVARAAYIAGCAGTATMEAGKILGIPTTGTMAHHYVMAYGVEEECEAFSEFLRHYPDKHSLLIDTFDINDGVINALRASRETGIPLKAVRIDSGDLDHWSRVVRTALDIGGQPQCQILVSNDLDEYAIAKLQDAPIDAWGVGTMLGTSADAPNLGGVYKLVEQHEVEPRYIMKLSADKATDPGRHQVWRKLGSSDTLTLADEPNPYIEDCPQLLLQVVYDGAAIGVTDLQAARSLCQRDLHYMPRGGYFLRRSSALTDLKTFLGYREESPSHH